MPELILTILRLIFLALIYLFIWQIARALSRHVGYTRSDSTRKLTNRVTVVRSDSQAGLSFLITDATVVGRSDQSDVVLEDPYASEFHFRLVAQDGALTVSGLSTDQVGRIAGAAGITLLELTAEQASLEDAFMTATGDAVEFRAPTTMGADR